MEKIQGKNIEYTFVDLRIVFSGLRMIGKLENSNRPPGKGAKSVEHASATVTTARYDTVQCFSCFSRRLVSV